MLIVNLEEDDRYHFITQPHRDDQPPDIFRGQLVALVNFNAGWRAVVGECNDWWYRTRILRRDTEVIGETVIATLSDVIHFFRYINHRQWVTIVDLGWCVDTA